MRRHRHGARRLTTAGLIASAAALGLGCQAAARREASPEILTTPTPARGAAEAKAQGKALDAPAGPKADPGLARAGFEPTASPEQEVGVRMELGRGHAEQGELEAAAVDYRKALEALSRPGGARKGARAVAAEKATAHRKLAVVLDRLGRFGESDAHYKDALKLAPDDPRVWNNAGYSQYIQGRWEEAERALRTAARLAPGDAKVATNLGLALAARGKLDEALAVMGPAVGPAAAHANIGYVLAATGRREQAVGHYRVALALRPDLATAREALARLAEAGGDDGAGAATPAATAAATATPSPPLPADDSVDRTSGAAAPAPMSAPKRGPFGL
jgi:Flp pilus assembly protein TadD